MTWVHKRQPYYRPASMGGDVSHPLCVAPITGWAGPRMARKAMTDLDHHVDCPRCGYHMARGGMVSRLSDLQHTLEQDSAGRAA